jgi:hypothetical protein
MKPTYGKHAAALALSVVISATAFTYAPDGALGQTSSSASDTLFAELFLEANANEARFAEALALWTELANKGDADAQYYLSFLYFRGLGNVERDEEHALSLIRAAAESGHVKAEYQLGYAYEVGQVYARDHEQAVSWYERAGTQGYWLATERLARAYAYGELGLPRDTRKADLWRSKREATDQANGDR